MKTTED